MKEKKPKPPAPIVRGEKWELMNGDVVTVLRLYGTAPLRSRVIEIIMKGGALTTVYESDFKKRLTGEKQ